MTALGGLIRELSSVGLLSLGDQPALVRSHHGALFLDRTVGDALGGEGWAVLKQGAFESSFALLSSVAAELGIRGPAERIDLAAEIFASLGHGKLTFEITAEGGMARGEDLYFGASHREKYERRVRTRKPQDAFAAGFAAAAASVAFPSDWGSFDADEIACVGRGDRGCSFVLARRPDRVRMGAVLTSEIAQTAASAVPPEANERSGSAAESMAQLIAALRSDERGGLRAFGVRLAVTPVAYPAQIAFDTMHLLEKRTPELFPVYSALVREGAQLDAFHVLGGVLASSSWMSEHGLPARDEELRLDQLLGIARALGWGALYTDDYSPGRSMVLRAPATWESVYYSVRHDRTVRSRLPSLQGIALALMQLLHRVDFRAERPIEEGTYESLFRSGPRYHVEETRSPLRGDDFCEVVVEAMAER